MFWRSVVGKLWFIILLFVMFVLFILIILLFQFFENYYVVDVENCLIKMVVKIFIIVQEMDDEKLGLFIVCEFVD